MALFHSSLQTHSSLQSPALAGESGAGGGSLAPEEISLWIEQAEEFRSRLREIEGAEWKSPAARAMAARAREGQSRILAIEARLDQLRALSADLGGALLLAEMKEAALGSGGLR